MVSSTQALTRALGPSLLDVNLTGAEPLICIIIPFTAWNPLVAECVAGCLRLDYGRFIVCLLPNESGGIPDGVLSDPRVKTIATGNPDISRKRNVGITAHPEAEFYACIDSDAVPEADWLLNAVTAFRRAPDIGLVGGPDISPEYPDVGRRAVRNALRSWLVSGERTFMKRVSPGRFTDDLRTANCIIRSAVIKEVGAFDEDLPVGEDSDLCISARLLGWKLWFDQEVIVRHHNRGLFRPFLKQRITTGYGVPALVRKHPDMPFHAWLLRLLPLAGVLFFLIGWTCRFLGAPFFLVWESAAALYLVAVLVEAVRQASRPGDIVPTAAALVIGNLGPGLGILLAAVGIKLNIPSFYCNQDSPP